MNITKKMLEEDAAMLLHDLRERDYPIPTTAEIIKPMCKYFSVVVFIQVIAGVVDNFIYGISDDPIYYGCMSASVVLPCVFFLAFSYGNISLFLCLSKDARSKSILIRLMKNKVNILFNVAVVLNISLAIFFLYFERGWVAFLGAGWFVSMLLLTGVFTLSTSRYMTPAVTATLAKINAVISSPHAEKTA